MGRTERILVVAAVLAAAVWITHIVNTSKDRDYEACRRGNVQRAYLINRSTELQQTATGASAKVLFPLVDCRATAENGGKTVTMRDRTALEFRRLVKAGRLPILEDGEVVDSEPIPTPR